MKKLCVLVVVAVLWAGVAWGYDDNSWEMWDDSSPEQKIKMAFFFSTGQIFSDIFLEQAMCQNKKTAACEEVKKLISTGSQRSMEKENFVRIAILMQMASETSECRLFHAGEVLFLTYIFVTRGSGDSGEYINFWVALGKLQKKEEISEDEKALLQRMRFLKEMAEALSS